MKLFCTTSECNIVSLKFDSRSTVDRFYRLCRYETMRVDPILAIMEKQRSNNCRLGIGLDSILIFAHVAVAVRSTEYCMRTYYQAASLMRPSNTIDVAPIPTTRVDNS